MRVCRPVQIAALAPMLAAVAVASAGCGSGASGTSIDPARAVPASAPLYAGAYVQPTGKLQDAARAAGRGLTHQADPYLRLLAALQTPGSSALDFKRDIAPWLGPRAGVFLTATGDSEERAVERLLTLVERGLLGSSSAGSAFPFAAHSVEGAIVLDSRDSAKARSFLAQLGSRASAHTSSYRGTSYQVNASGIAFAIVAKLAVIGTESGVRAVIDTTAGAPSLAHNPDYAKLQAVAPAGTLANVYANAGAFGGGGAAASKQASMSAFSALAGGGLVNVSLVPSSSTIAVDADALQTSTSAGSDSGGLFSASAPAAQALGELPAESWLAVGLGDVGKTLGADVDAIQGITSLGSSLTGAGAEGEAAGISVKGLLEGILAPLRALGAESAQTRREFASWMGSAGLFAAGAGLLELKGGVVIDSNDAARSRAAVAELGSLLRRGGASVQSTKLPGTEAAVAARLSGLPVELDIAAGVDANGHAKFVIGLGEQSIDAALDPTSTISGSAPYGTASAALGQGIAPSVIVDFPTLLGLLEGVGLSEDPSIAPFVPYLRSLSTLSGGGRTLGNGIERFRLVLGLQSAAG
ncbi:MAG TPA: DUF3352 domain-containing protein [Solirubrobacteraceae bacterium]|nr:DUF3352 domain-containing protein [Solirubrobacteraceae bacterium]